MATETAHPSESDIPQTREFYLGVDAETQDRFLKLRIAIREAEAEWMGRLSPGDWDSFVALAKAGGERSFLSAENNAKVSQADAGVRKLRDILEASGATIEQVRQIIREADEHSRGTISMEFRAGMRLAAFAAAFPDSLLHYQLVTDIDGTATLMQAYRGTEIADPILMGAGLVDPLEHGQTTKPSVYRPLTRLVRTPVVREYDELFREGGRIVPLRPGMDILYQKHEAKGGHITALSTNSKPFVEEVFQRQGVKNADIIAVTADEEIGAIAFEKDLVLQGIAASRPKEMIVYVGDGSSDLAALKPEARSVVGIYFALKDSPFAAQLKAEQDAEIAQFGHSDIVFFEYVTGDDIIDTMNQVESYQKAFTSLQTLRRGVPQTPLAT